ncbi:MAG: FtsX-like permease family protein [Bacteroidetes bacterium]|nr:FtsX-like permease family protein [Bacteroidota bacterium]
MSLLKNYVRSLLRNAVRDKYFTFLNMMGLAVGITASILIFIYIQDQVNYDSHNENYDRIYRLEGDFFISEKQDLTAITQVPLGPTLKDEYPEIVEQARIVNYRNFTGGDLYFEKEENTFREDSIMWADSTLFKIFSIPFISGDPGTALSQPSTMVLSESLAKKYFGSTDVLGESLKTLDGGVYTIVGVFENLPVNVHMNFNGLISTATIEEQIGSEQFNDRSTNSFWNVATYTYVLMAENTTPDMVLAKFPEFYDTYMKELGEQINASFDLRITPLRDVHFQKDELTWDLPKGNMNYVYIMGVIGVLLIIIASINYTNLTTARATSRGKEIGVRKVGGASKGNLRSQFLGESIVTAIVAGAVASLLTALSLPLFNTLSGNSFSWQVLLQPTIILFIIGISFLTGILSGIYPSTYLASFNPVSILKGNGVSEKDRGWMRRGLVIAQFLISAMMMIGSVVVALQMNFIQQKDLGFDKDQILMLSLNDTSIVNNASAFMEEIERHPAVENTSISTTAPGRFYGKQVMTAEQNSGEMIEKAFNQCFIDFDYMDVMGLTLVEGRFYDREFGSDMTNAFIVNQALVDEMQWGDSALGKQFIRGVNIQGANNPVGEIIGVVEDYNYGSLHNPVQPLLMACQENAQFMRTLSVRISGNQIEEVLPWIEEQRASFNPAYPIQYSYLSDELENLYEEERIIFALVLTFSILIIFLSSLGLLALSAFMTAKRTRETGIRRVMGASQNQILSLFLFQFSKWVVISNIIAWPVSFFVMKNWLQNFTYRIEFPFWTFILSLLLSLTIAVITVSWQSIKVSRMNPAASIRAE